MADDTDLRFRAFLCQLGFEIWEVASDGHCFFSALARGLYILGLFVENSTAVRSRLGIIIRNNSLKGEIGKHFELQNYTYRQLENEFQGVATDLWGDDTCCMAAVLTWKINITVFSSPNVILRFPEIQNPALPTIYLSFHRHLQHYNYLHLRPDFSYALNSYLNAVMGEHGESSTNSTGTSKISSQRNDNSSSHSSGSDSDEMTRAIEKDVVWKRMRKVHQKLDRGCYKEDVILVNDEEDHFPTSASPSVEIPKASISKRRKRKRVDDDDEDWVPPQKHGNSTTKKRKIETSLEITKVPTTNTRARITVYHKLSSNNREDIKDKDIQSDRGNVQVLEIKETQNLRSLVNQKRTDTKNQKVIKEPSKMSHQEENQDLLEVEDLERIQNVCPICQKVYQSKKGLQNHMSIHSEQPQFECSECDEKFYDSTVLYRHKARIHGEEEFDCMDCHRTFKSKNDLNHHVRGMHAEHFLRCHLCGEEMKTSENHLYHLKTRHDMRSPFSCPEQKCEYEGTRLQFQMHWLQVHSNNKICNCLDCRSVGFSWNPVDEIYEPLKLDKEQPCGISYPTSKSNPMVFSNEESNVLQSDANSPAIFRKKTYRSNREKQVRQNGSGIMSSEKVKLKRFSCEVCKEMFKNKSDLGIHIYRHHTKHNLKCHLCDRTMVDIDTHYFHLRKYHFLRPPFICPESTCEFQGTRLQLQMHYLKQHCDNKSCDCDDCKADEEKQVHPEGAPFECSHCHKILTTKVHLKRHISTMHSEAWIICHLCGKKLMNLDHHYRHIRSEHGYNRSPFECKHKECNFSGTRHELQMHWKNNHRIDKDCGCLDCKNDETNFNGRRQESVTKTKIPLTKQPNVNSATTINCHFCSDKFKNVDLHYDHLRSRHGFDRSPFQCMDKNCDFSGTRHQLQMHWIQVHQQSKKCGCADCNTEVFYRKSRFKAPEKLAQTKHTLQPHIRAIYLEGTIKCHYCGTDAKTFAKHYSHLRRQHGFTNSPFECNEDDCNFSGTRHEIQMHLKKKHGKNKNCECADCKVDEIYQNPAILPPIKRTADTNKKSRLAYYRRLNPNGSIPQAKVVRLPCGQCQKTFKTQPDLNRHTRDYHTRVNLRCHICNKKMETVEAHRIHLKERHGLCHPYRCPICRYVGSRYQLQMHFLEKHRRNAVCNCFDCEAEAPPRVSRIFPNKVLRIFEKNSNLQLIKRYKKRYEKGDYSCSTCTFTTTSKRCMEVHLLRKNCLTTMTCKYKIQKEEYKREHLERQHLSTSIFAEQRQKQINLLRNLHRVSEAQMEKDAKEIYRISKALYKFLNHRRKLYGLLCVPKHVKNYREYVRVRKGGRKNQYFFNVGRKSCGTQPEHISLHHYKGGSFVATKALIDISNFKLVHVFDIWCEGSIPGIDQCDEETLMRIEGRMILKLLLFAIHYKREDIFFQKLELAPLSDLTRAELEEMMDDIKKSNGDLFKLEHFRFKFQQVYTCKRRRVSKRKQKFNCPLCSAKLFSTSMLKRHIAKCHQSKTAQLASDSRADALLSMQEVDLDLVLRVCQMKDTPHKHYCYTYAGVMGKMNRPELVLKAIKQYKKHKNYHGKSVTGHPANYHFDEDSPSTLKNLEEEGFTILHICDWECNSWKNMMRLEISLQVNEIVYGAFNGKENVLANRILVLSNICNLFTENEWVEFLVYCKTNRMLFDDLPSFINGKRIYRLQELTKELKTMNSCSTYEGSSDSSDDSATSDSSDDSTTGD